jgi:hypothetical protein
MNTDKKKEKRKRILSYKRATPIVPSFILKSFYEQFNIEQRDIIFKMLKYFNDWNRGKHHINKDFKDSIFTVYFFMEAISRDMREKYTLTKNGLKTLVALYYMNTILDRPVKLIEVVVLFKYGTYPKNKTCLASLRYLRKIGYADYVRVKGYVITKLGIQVINYISVRVTDYKKQFIEKKADIKFREKHGLSNEFVYLDSK